MKKTKTQNGITLIALIITIVVLLILAVVAINAVTGDGIIQHAVNAKEDYQKASDAEEAMLGNYLEVLNDKTKSEPKVTWTKTSAGDLVIGSTVKTSTNEEFYVIGGDTVGTAITSNTQKIILLAKDNLKADGSAQDTTGAINPCAFCTDTAWNGASVAENDDLNTKATIKEDTTSAVYKAIKYGETLGATGRLMLKSEADDLNNDEYRDILYGKNGKSSGTYLNYWLGSAFFTSSVWFVLGSSSSLFDNDFDDGSVFGVRPVVEVLKSNIS